MKQHSLNLIEESIHQISLSESVPKGAKKLGELLRKLVNSLQFSLDKAEFQMKLTVLETLAGDLDRAVSIDNPFNLIYPYQEVLSTFYEKAGFSFAFSGSSLPQLQ